MMLNRKYIQEICFLEIKQVKICFLKFEKADFLSKLDERIFLKNRTIDDRFNMIYI